MTTETIDIRVRATGADTVKRQIDSIADSADNASKAGSALGNAIGALAVAGVGTAVAGAAKSWSDFSRVISSSTKSASEATRIMDQLYTSAQKSGSNINDVASMFSRLQIAAGSMGKTADEVAKFSEALGNMITATGGSAKEASGALVQMSQAMASGTFRAEEFNSMVEGMPGVMDKVAKSMYGANANIGTLREHMLKGEVTADKFFNAIMQGAAEAEQKMASMPLTISSAVTNLQSAFAKQIGGLDSALGISDGAARAIQVVADHMREIVGLASGVGTALATAFAPAVITRFSAAVTSLFALISAHPIGALATAIAGLAGYLMSAYSDVQVLGDGLTTLGDVGAAAFNAIKSIGSSAFEGIVSYVRQVVNAISNFFDLGGTSWSISSENAANDIKSDFTGILLAATTVLDKVAQAFDKFSKLASATVGKIPEAFRNAGAKVGSLIAGPMESAINGAIRALNKLTGTSIGEVKIRPQVDTNFLSKAKQDLNDALAYKSDWTPFTDGAKRLIASAKELGEQRRKLVVNAGNLIGGDQVPRASVSSKTPSIKASSTPAVKAQSDALDDVIRKSEEAAKKQEELAKQVVAATNPMVSATEEFAAKQQALNDVLGVGTAEHARYSAALREAYQSRLEPMSAVTAALEEQEKVSSMSASQARQEAEVQRYVQQIQSQGISLTEQEIDSIRKRVAAINESQTARQQEMMVLQQSLTVQRQMAEQQLQAASRLQQSGQIGMGDVNTLIGNQIGNQVQQARDTGYDAQLRGLQSYYERVEALRQQDLISEQTAIAAKRQINEQQTQVQMGLWSTMFGNLTTLQRSSSSRMAKIGKAAAYAQAVINIAQGVTMALAQGGPFMGPALAATVAAAGGVQLAQIRSQQDAFATGGSFVVGGKQSGGQDSQLVQFRASPGERVTISTPEQVRKGSNSVLGDDSAQVTPVVNIINVLDKDLMSDYVNSKDGQQSIINIIARNRRVVTG